MTQILSVFGMACPLANRQSAAVNDVTRLLAEMAAGDAKAGEKLIAIVYAELRRMAARQMSGQDGQTLQPTALVHEAWLKLAGERTHGWENRAHFFATAAMAMRSILVDRARRRKAMRHGGGQVRVAWEDIDVANGDGSACDDQILAVHEVLEKLAAEHPQKAELVKLRYFAGLSMKEAADVLGVSEPTAHRWWAYARAWLGREIAL
jgi:RNA polymerase sigma factor (TIGR02999 family)